MYNIKQNAYTSGSATVPTNKNDTLISGCSTIEKRQNDSNKPTSSGMYSKIISARLPASTTPFGVMHLNGDAAADADKGS